jgi:hypothetical protein
MQIDIGYDPNVTIQRRINERLNSISNDIESGRLKDSELKSKFTELDILKQQVESYNSRRLTISKKEPESAYEMRHKNVSANQIENQTVPKINMSKKTSDNKSSNRPIKTGETEKPLASNDYKIRPGFEMTLEQIKKRGSFASFDTSKVGILDYKKTVQFLCSQIKSAGLGEPREFGCIENPEAEVRHDYSWKGNYKMVCSRLGRTWGEFYPEMFGCPAPDDAHNHYPKINKTCTTSANKPLPIEHPNVPCKS